jgi:hypothetical protein
MSALLESAQELLASKDQVCCCQMWLLVLRKLLMCLRKLVCMVPAHLNTGCLHIRAASPLQPHVPLMLDASGDSPAAIDRS